MPKTPPPSHHDELYAPIRRRAYPPPASIVGGVGGVYGIVQAVVGASGGSYRVRNDIDGYLVYLGVDQRPDFTSTPIFSATLPFNVPLAPPASGARTYYVTIRKRNEYGLESQEQWTKTFTIDQFGQLVLPELPLPFAVAAYPLRGGMVRVEAQYNGDDEYPPTLWRAWIKTTAIDVDVDSPNLQSSVSGRYSTLGLYGPATPGTYNVAVALCRQADDEQGPPVYTTVVLPSPPNAPQPVLGGDEED